MIYIPGVDDQDFMAAARRDFEKLSLRTDGLRLEAVDAPADEENLSPTGTGHGIVRRLMGLMPDDDSAEARQNREYQGRASQPMAATKKPRRAPADPDAPQFAATSEDYEY